MNILVMNCGSSSLKYQLIDMVNESVLAKGLCERIGIEGSVLTHSPAGKDKVKFEKPMPSHKEAIQMVMDALVDKECGVISSTDEIAAIGHRVVHGGTYYSDSVVVDEKVKEAIKDCFDLAPLHNPANLMGIEACEAAAPGKPNVAVFDTAFGMNMEEKAYLYALPYEYFEKYHVRRYGFHGTSHSFVSGEAIKFAGLDPKTAKVIVCHLGNGASVSASIGGKCVDTSMGLTPLEGLIMGTRSGDLDPAVLEYICNKEGLNVSQMLTILNKKSGVMALSNNLSSDFRDLEEAMDNGNEAARLAIEAFSYRVAKYIGSYVAAMNGVDAIVFTGGIGENAGVVRKTVLSYLGYLGITMDEAANKKRGENFILSTPDSKVKVAVMPTNEELAICRDTVELVNAAK